MSAAGGGLDAVNGAVLTQPNSAVPGAGFRRGRKLSPDAVHKIAQIRPQNTITIKLTTKKHRVHCLSVVASTAAFGFRSGNIGEDNEEVDEEDDGVLGDELEWDEKITSSDPRSHFLSDLPTAEVSDEKVAFRSEN